MAQDRSEGLKGSGGLVTFLCLVPEETFWAKSGLGFPVKTSLK